MDVFSGEDMPAMMEKSSALIGQYRKPTTLERLRAQREALAAKLAETDEAIRALESYPEVERIIAALNRAL
jgi:hypothetical protein